MMTRATELEPSALPQPCLDSGPLKRQIGRAGGAPTGLFAYLKPLSSVGLYYM